MAAAAPLRRRRRPLPFFAKATKGKGTLVVRGRRTGRVEDASGLVYRSGGAGYGYRLGNSREY